MIFPHKRQWCFLHVNGWNEALSIELSEQVQTMVRQGLLA